MLGEDTAAKVLLWPEPEQHIDLFLPERNYTVQAAVYPVDEYAAFMVWLIKVYTPEKLPGYLMKKPEFKRHGTLVGASVAENHCLKWNGGPATIPQKEQEATGRCRRVLPGRLRVAGTGSPSEETLRLMG